MHRRQKIYFSLLGLSLFWTLAMLLTLLPWSSASRESILGYRALCSLAPFSTLMCGFLAAMTCVVRKNRFMLVNDPPIIKKMVLLGAAFFLFGAMGGFTAGYYSLPLHGGMLKGVQLKDGHYRGEYQVGYYFSAQVDVLVAENAVRAVKVARNRGTLDTTDVNRFIPQRIIAQQSTRVDAVSGATFSSRLLMNAVHNALQKAR